MKSKDNFIKTTLCDGSLTCHDICKQASKQASKHNYHSSTFVYALKPELFESTNHNDKLIGEWSLRRWENEAHKRQFPINLFKEMPMSGKHLFSTILMVIGFTTTVLAACGGGGGSKDAVEDYRFDDTIVDESDLISDVRQDDLAESDLIPDVQQDDVMDLPTDGDVPMDSQTGCTPPCTEGSCCAGVCVTLGNDISNCGTCGHACEESESCIAGECKLCMPNCVGKECGDNGCHGTCGNCTTSEACINDICVSWNCSCVGKECGDDGCGHSCGTCGEDKKCEEGYCVDCTANCASKHCGDDNGCHGKCDGDCPFGGTCRDGICIGTCTPDCTGRECGNDGCGGQCGGCNYPSNCELGQCVCVSKCIMEGWLCGPDGCFGSCGVCPEGKICNVFRICVDDPAIVGCSDGTREGFVNISDFPNIASCAGAWDAQSLRGTSTHTPCGDDLSHCNTPADLCYEGWHICMKNGWPGDIADRISAADCHSGVAGSGVFVAASNNAISVTNCCAYSPLPYNCTDSVTGRNCIPEVSSEPGYPYLQTIACGTDTRIEPCMRGIWENNTPSAHGIACNDTTGGPTETVNGVLCCKDPPVVGH